MTAVETLKIAVPSNDTGFKKRTITTLSEDRHLMAMYGGGGYVRQDVTIEELYIFTATAISAFKEMGHSAIAATRFIP